MPDIAHASITDPNLHEPKGVAIANDGEVYVADGAGSGNWAKLITRYTEAIETSSPVFSVPGSSTREYTFTVSGVDPATDTVLAVTKPTYQSELVVVHAIVYAINEITVTFFNNASESDQPTDGEVYTFDVLRLS